MHAHTQTHTHTPDIVPTCAQLAVLRDVILMRTWSWVQILGVEGGRWTFSEGWTVCVFVRVDIHVPFACVCVVPLRIRSPFFLMFCVFRFCFRMLSVTLFRLFIWKNCFVLIDSDFFFEIITQWWMGWATVTVSSFRNGACMVITYRFHCSVQNHNSTCDQTFFSVIVLHKSTLQPKVMFSHGRDCECESPEPSLLIFCPCPADTDRIAVPVHIWSLCVWIVCHTLWVSANVVVVNCVLTDRILFKSRIYVHSVHVFLCAWTVVLIVCIVI